MAELNMVFLRSLADSEARSSVIDRCGISDRIDCSSGGGGSGCGLVSGDGMTEAQSRGEVAHATTWCQNRDYEGTWMLLFFCACKVCLCAYLTTNIHILKGIATELDKDENIGGLWMATGAGSCLKGHAHGSGRGEHSVDRGGLYEKLSDLELIHRSQPEQWHEQQHQHRNLGWATGGTRASHLETLGEGHEAKDNWAVALDNSSLPAVSARPPGHKHLSNHQHHQHHRHFWLHCKVRSTSTCTWAYCAHIYMHMQTPHIHGPCVCQVVP